MSNKSRERQVTHLPTANSALCTFWKRANQLFEALAGVWNCTGCQGSHSAMLLLQHRKDSNSDFNITFTRPVQKQWKVQNTRISEKPRLTLQGSKLEASIRATASPVVHEPGHRRAQLTKSVMKSPMKQIGSQRSKSPRAKTLFIPVTYYCAGRFPS